ncbi:MAG: chromate efflux transporter [Halofilum sp. (in: g-proteobacteria)]|nr:chromate efflux transporter [Halofilum sp. (in: g-proteobacteria)]
MAAGAPAAAGTAREVFGVFLRLGLTSFGGPIAHLAYYRRELVERRAWLDDEQYGQLLAFTHFLPGPASTQIGFSLGLLRAGWPGALAAFGAFALPSALLMFAFATLLPALSGPWAAAALHGLKLVALSVVAHGVVGMARRLCPDLPRAAIAVVAAGAILLAASVALQLLVIAAAALAGLLLCRHLAPVAARDLPLPHGPRLGILLLTVFALLLAALPWLAASGGLAAAAAAFYRAGALVFGGGHVVLPLLQQGVVQPGWIGADEFLSGYGAAQALPGPLFTFSAFLGARLPGADGGATGALVALAAIFLPGLLLVAGGLPLWRSLARRPAAVRMVAGVNAGVVGLLAAALYDPLWVSAVRAPADVAIAAAGLAALQFARLSPLWIVLWCVLASLGLAVTFPR